VEWTGKTLLELRDAIARKQVSAVEVTRVFLDRIEALNPNLNACSEVYAERALRRAQAVDEGRVTGMLAGVPVTLKDNICTSFGRTTCSSRMLADYHSPFDATVTARIEAAGAVVLGKTNMDEFAMGSSTENSAIGPTRNPWDPQRVPGGSSGGSAAAVAARLCAASLGSDTGGSIRQPAAYCGVVGLKPTYGLVSRYGLVAYASSLDQVGPITRTVADAAALLNVIAAHDPLDSTSSPDPRPDYGAELERPVEALRLGVARQYMSPANSPDVRRAMENALEGYTAAGAQIVEVDLPHTEYGIPTYYIVATAEASSNLARYDGVHYGHRAENPSDLIDLYAASRAEGFGREVKRRIMLGTYALSSGYYDAYYVRALKVRRLIKQDFDRAFEQCQAILCPAATEPAFAFGEKSADPLAMYLNDVYTVNCNLAGLPGLVVPVGCTRGEPRIPIGLQLIGPAHSEPTLLRIGRMLEKIGESLIPEGCTPR